MFKKFQRLFHRHVQYIINCLSFIFHFQSFSVIAFSSTHFTRYIYIRQEMHLNLNDSISAAGLTASALHIEAESSFFIASRFCIRCCCEQITNQIKYTRICCRIGTRCSSNRRLINVDHFIYLLQPFNSRMPSRNCSCMVQFFGKCFV